eukprot:938076-Prymnesium_polylepis.1
MCIRDRATITRCLAATDPNCASLAHERSQCLLGDRIRWNWCFAVERPMGSWNLASEASD